MNDDQRLLASAALDGDVTAEERTRAESDPEVVAEIERLRAVRAALPVVERPDADRREAAIAAALAAFDRPVAAPSPGAVVAPTAPRSRRGHRWLAPLAAAAAVAVIAVGGIVATRSDGGDEDSSSAALATAVADTGSEGSERVLGAAPEPADAGAGSAVAEAESDAATEAAPQDTAATAATAPMAPAATDAPLGSPEELAAFVGVTERAAPDTTPTCSGGTFVGEASYVVAAEAVPVEVFEVDTPHQAVARRLGDCRIVARAPLP